MQEILTKRKTVKSPLETEDGAGSYDMKERDIQHESEPIASSTLIQIERTAMSKLVQQRALLRFIEHVSFSNLAEKHNLGV